jgi:protein gp37
VSDRSTIEWTDASWNPVTGCTQVSPGCDHCYALTFAERFRGVPGHPYEQGFDLRLWPERLELPLTWRRPRRIFVNSMSDLFHRDVPTDYIQQVFGTMRRADWHVFQILTKRPGRLRRIAADLPWPQNVWMGVSIEASEFAWRASYLREVPAAVRFVSAEPLLGPLDGVDLRGIDWIITGGESGPGHRPINESWVRALRDRCNAEGVAFFHKQWGGRWPKQGGRELDGRTYDEWPKPRLDRWVPTESPSSDTDVMPPAEFTAPQRTLPSRQD